MAIPYLLPVRVLSLYQRLSGTGDLVTMEAEVMEDEELTYADYINFSSEWLKEKLRMSSLGRPNR